MRQLVFIIGLLSFSLFSYAQKPPKLKQSEETKLWGYVNAQDKVVINYQYEKASNFYQGFARVQKKGKWGVINPEGKVILKIKYEAVSYFKNGYMPVKTNGKWGLVDKNNDRHPKVQGYEELFAQFGKNDLYHATKNGLQGIVDLEGKTYFPFKYHRVFPWSDDENIYVVKVGEKFGLAKTDGTEIIPPNYQVDLKNFPFRFDGDIAYYEADAHFKLFDGKKWGVLDANGKEIIPFEYDNIRLYDDKKDYGKFQVAILTQGNQKQLVGKDLKPVLDQEFTEIYGFYCNNSNYLMIQFADQIKFFHAVNHTILDEIPDAVSKKFGKFSMGGFDGKKGIISETGEQLTPMAYDYLYDLDYNADLKSKPFSTLKNQLYGVYRVGKGQIIPIEFTSVRYFKANNLEFYAIQNQDKKWALYNADGKVLTDFSYKNIIKDYKSKKIKAQLGENWFELDVDGKDKPWADK